MIEITFADMFLLGWAIVATLYVVKLKGEYERSRYAMNQLLDNDVLRDRVVTEYKEWKNEQLNRM